MPTDPGATVWHLYVDESGAFRDPEARHVGFDNQWGGPGSARLRLA
jgi:hypothetical protein